MLKSSTCYCRLHKKVSNWNLGRIGGKMGHGYCWILKNSVVASKPCKIFNVLKTCILYQVNFNLLNSLITNYKRFCPILIHLSTLV